MNAALAEREAPPDDLQAEVPAVLQWAKDLAIATAQEYQEAADRLKGIKALSRRIADFFSPMKRAADQAKKALLDREREYAAPLAQAETLAKNAMLVYQRREQEKADAERRRLQAEADEKARRERERLEKLAEQSKKPETKAKYQEAAAEVAPAPVVHVENAAPKVTGVSVRRTWKATIIDPVAFFAAVHDQKRDDFIQPNDKAIENYAKAMGERAAFPGIRFFQQESLASGR